MYKIRKNEAACSLLWCTIRVRAMVRAHIFRDRCSARSRARKRVRHAIPFLCRARPCPRPTAEAAGRHVLACAPWIVLRGEHNTQSLQRFQRRFSLCQYRNRVGHLSVVEGNHYNRYSNETSLANRPNTCVTDGSGTRQHSVPVDRTHNTCRA
jgi:hypothetical protein